LAICNHCGDEIDFRWIDGSVRPIHINGGGCSGGLSGEIGYAISRFESVKSYLDPNARCPVCGKSVFFYRSPYNGRVFFDAVGWPWPKHGCTDKYQGRDTDIRRPVSGRYNFNFRTRSGAALEVFVLSKIHENESELLLKLLNTEKHRYIDVAVNRHQLLSQLIFTEDLKEAPSLVLTREVTPEGTLEIGFVSARLQSVISIIARPI
jgi:hypothetical protein